jgi:acetyl-CoA C-acetyltransferase
MKGKLTMSRKVAIVSTFQTKCTSALVDLTLEELIFQTTRAALAEAELTIEDVDSVFTSSSDQIDGRAISMMLTSGPSGGESRDLLNPQGAGEHALILACLKILSGMSDIALVINWTKCSEVDVGQVERLSTDPFFERDLWLNSTIAAALQASAYVEKYHPSGESVSLLVQKNRKNAMRNPYAHIRKEVTVQEVFESPVISWPLRLLELPPLSDGAGALVLASDRKAKLLGGNYAWIKGFGWSVDGYFLGDRDLSFLTSLSIAANQAYKMAGIKEPKKEIKIAELQEITAYHELMEYEALGFCEKGGGSILVKEGVTDFRGPLPVNPSGGTLSSNPLFASGLIRVIEAARQVTGKAGEGQVANSTTALAHGTSGFACQNNSVFIIGKE